MEKIMLEIVQTGLTLDTVWLVVQLIAAAFLVLAIRGWVMKTWAWRTFCKSTDVSIGTKLKISVSGVVLAEGRIVSANKSRVVLENDKARILMRTQEFVNQTWTILKEGAE